MKYASVIIPLVLVGVLFLLGCIWVATRGDRDREEDEESLPGAEPTPKTESRAPKLAIPAPAHVRSPPIDLTHSSSNSFDHEPPRYER